MFFGYISSKVYQEFDEFRAEIEQEKERLEQALRMSENCAQDVSKLLVLGKR